MPALPWPANWTKAESHAEEEVQGLLRRAQANLNAIPASVLALSAFALGSITTVSGTMVYRRYFRRLKNGDWITPDVFARKRWVKGRVTSVGDSDNFRFYHTPGFGWHWPIKFRQIPSTPKGRACSLQLKDKTLHIRIAGVDAPEGAHFGKPAQPYSEESLAWLRQQILGKTVYCQLLRRDQYARIVSIVAFPPRFLPASWASGKSLSLEMLRAGWVTIYEQAGAEYGKWGKEGFLRVENEAKAARRGMWANGTTAETPAEYKRRHAQADISANTKIVDKRATIKTESSSAKPASNGKTGWLRRLFSR
ncbi:putative endonuclease LCL3 [Mycena sanguinolenta]|uniref:Putative endonuclease LCL3 n=1 Tax=Mycena sanguinolenta TaxID=230812 RepID=A0A8H7DL16_9AGAR|nr:putative endonuclease LCL3 [Mycena sanguinolenta]